MLKWKLLLTTLPFVAGMIVITFIRQSVLEIPGLIEFSDFSPVVTATALIIGFMYSGVIADYKESEKLPSQIILSLEAIHDTFSELALAGKPVDLSYARRQHFAVLSTVEDWLMNRVSLSQCWEALRGLNEITAHIERAGASTAHTGRTLAETVNLRAAVNRIHIIRTTSFIQTGYVLLYALVSAVLLLLLIANFKSLVSQYLIVASLSLIYIYLIFLIHDLDNPFDYADGIQVGSSEVSLDPLYFYHPILENSIKS
ncbi:conserved membrane hypothetical protein [Gammaproteobacteria bacterium]